MVSCKRRYTEHTVMIYYYLGTAEIPKKKIKVCKHATLV